MKTALFFDTETTGLPLFNDPSDDPRQPHLVQLAACLVDLDKRATISSMDVTIAPRGWKIPEDVAAIHGITTEIAEAIGIDEHLALMMFTDLWQRAQRRIAHNQTFDERIIRIAKMRYQDRERAEAWAAGQAECTQLLATPILKLPPTAKMIAAKRNHHKSANLGEAFEYFTGRKLEGAHSAMVDVQACMTVYWAIQDLKLKEAA